MTTIHVPIVQDRVRATARRFATFAAAALLLAGCASENALNGGATQASLAPPAAAPVQPTQPLTKVTIAPVIGAPDTIGRQLQQDFTAAVGLQKVSLVAPGDRPDFTLKGFVVAAKDRANTKVSYIWDVIDPAGKRVNRFTGEEIITGQTPKDPWSAVTPDLARTIAQKSAASFGQWLPTAQSSIPVAAATGPVGVGANSGVASIQTAATPGVTSGAVAGRAATVTPVSAPAGGGAVAVVPAVVGAPGDGSTSLTGAIQSELRKSGVNLTAQPAANTYRVEGVVKMGQIKDGKQPIRIDWNVRDPQGNKVGTVSQNNEIPEGSLDGAWGKTADAAAQAAAQGIIKLLPR